MTPSQLLEGTLIQGTVSSLEDKGYIIDVGMEFIRGAFLKIKKSIEGN